MTTAPASPLPRWYVTFGFDQQLHAGRVATDHRGEGYGLNLGHSYALIPAPTREYARAIVIEVFGPGNWCDIYPEDRGRALVEQHQLRPLFTEETTQNLASVDLCDCERVTFAHGPYFHAMTEG